MKPTLEETLAARIHDLTPCIGEKWIMVRRADVLAAIAETLAGGEWREPSGPCWFVFTENQTHKFSGEKEPPRLEGETGRSFMQLVARGEPTRKITAEMLVEWEGEWQKHPNGVSRYQFLTARIEAAGEHLPLECRCLSKGIENCPAHKNDTFSMTPAVFHALANEPPKESK